MLPVDLWQPAWEEIEGYREQLAPLEEGSLWPPFTDERIHAIVSLAPCYGPLFGERGLAVAHVPIFLINGTEDLVCPYERDTVFMFEHLGSEYAYLLSLIDQGHGVVLDPDYAIYLNHFSTAFFGYFLQGKEEYAGYLTTEYVEQFEELAWGIYTEE